MLLPMMQDDHAEEEAAFIFVERAAWNAQCAKHIQIEPCAEETRRPREVPWQLRSGKLPSSSDPSGARTCGAVDFPSGNKPARASRSTRFSIVRIESAAAGTRSATLSNSVSENGTRASSEKAMV
jgi:hypothetical protein